MTYPIDLPEPKKRVITPAERVQRQRRVLTALLYLVIGYAFVHKLAVPFVLKFTRLRESPYAEIDLWFFPALALGLALRSQRYWLTSFLAGGGILYGALEVIAGMRGVYPGWLAISRVLSSAPFAGICIGLLSGPFPERVPRAAWYGVATVAAIKLFARMGGL